MHTTMATPTPDADGFDITVRVGCRLTYEVTGSATLLLNSSKFFLFINS